MADKETKGGTFCPSGQTMNTQKGDSGIFNKVYLSKRITLTVAVVIFSF